MSSMAASSSFGDSCSSYRFLSEPDETLKCLICLEVAKDPWQHVDCGRLFCKECLNRLGKRKPCPNCRMEQPQYFPDNRSRREISFLCVKCPNVDRSCSWEGVIDTVEEHVAKCQFTLLPCPNHCQDGKHVMRKEIEDHLKDSCPNREYTCQYCGQKGTYTSITQVHDDRCQRKFVPCTNTECPRTIRRQHVSRHVNSECEYTVVACKHKSIGCETELKRKDMEAHELDDKLHLHVAINTITFLKENVSQLQEDFARLESQFKMTTMQSKEDFAQFETQLKKTISQSLMNTDARLKTVATMSMELGNQLNETTVQSMAAITQLKEANKKIAQLETLLIKQDTVNFRFVNYQKRKENRKEFIFPPFYTSHGYHMTLTVFANGHGIGRGTHISVFARIEEGKHDSSIPWPFVGSITFTLLNQLEDENHYSLSVPLTSEHFLVVGNGRGYPNFFPHSSLDHNPTYNTQYLKDNTLYFRLSVKVEDSKPWLQCLAAT